MKLLRTIAILAIPIFALRGEAASAWEGLSRTSPIDLPDITGGRTPGGPGIDTDAYEQRADQVVNYSLNIKGLGDASASVYIIGIEPYPEEYQYMLENATSPAYGNLFMGNATGDQTLTAVEQLGTPEINDINNWYCEIFIDTDNYMISRLGESPDYSLVFDHVGDWHGYEEMTIYNLTASITYESGYISPYHEGPDPLPTPEPTSGLLLLLGIAGLALRRRKAA